MTEHALSTVLGSSDGFTHAPRMKMPKCEEMDTGLPSIEVEKFYRTPESRPAPDTDKDRFSYDLAKTKIKFSFDLKTGQEYKNTKK